MKAWIFPGQGSQFKGMGKDLFSRYPEEMNSANVILGYSIKELCLEDTQNRLMQTQYTQPAIYVVSALMYLEKSKSSPDPEYLAGHSMGEYTALFAADVYNFEEGLKLVKKRGEIMSESKGGGMAVIIDLDEDGIQGVITDNNLEIDIANLNSKSQIVVAGKKEDIENNQSLFLSAGAKHYIPLAVSGAFHSRYMKNASEEFSNYLESITFQEPTTNVISNVTARPVDSEDIKDLLVKQLYYPVKWGESIRYLMSKGVSEFEEIGPGNVLKNLVVKIENEYRPLP